MLGIRGGGYHDFPPNLFCLTVSKHFVEEPFRKFRVSKNFMPKRGKSRFSIENFLSRSTEKIRRGTLVCCVSEDFQERKSLKIRGGEERGSITIFRRNNYQKCRWRLGFEPVSSASKPCCPTHCATGTIGISDKCQWNHKNKWHDRDSDPDLLLENHVVLTPLLSFDFE